MIQSPWMFLVSVLVIITHVSEVSTTLGPRCSSDVYYPTSMTKEEYLRTHCCKARSNSNGYTISWSPCSNGCCGDPDDQDCCGGGPLSSTEIGIIVGCSIFGLLVLIGLIVLFVWIGKHCRRRIRDYSDNKKILTGISSARTLDEVFTPSQPLVSAPGTIVHPVTNMNGLYLVDYCQTYVVPPPNQPQPPAIIALRPPGDNVIDGDSCNFGDEDSWDQWDGFSSEVRDHSGVTSSTGRGRDAPFSSEADGPGRPYYYEGYDRYTQPPPAYEVVTQDRREDSASPSS